MTHILLSMMSRGKALRLAWDVWRTSRAKTSTIAAHQQTRLADLIEFARVHSRLYGKLFRHLTFPNSDLRDLPPVKKQDLMANFDDWVILEPVDANYQPAPPGEASRTALITNLVNRVQPIIRYDLGDSITPSPDPCPCGSTLPAIRVKGRCDEILSFPAQGGMVVKLSPRALANVVDGTPGIRCFQVIQTAPEVLTVRLEVEPESDSSGVWERVACRMRDYLSVQGLPSIRVEKAQEPPKRDPVSGKFRNVWSELKNMKR